MSTPKIKVALNGQGGELDCRVVECSEGTDPYEQGGAVCNAIVHIAKRTVFSDGDTITVEQMN